MPRAGPDKVAITSPGLDDRTIFVLDTHLDCRVDEFEGEPSKIEPGNGASLASDNMGRGPVANWYDRVGREIARAADVFKQGHTNQWFDHDAREGRERHCVPCVRAN